MLQISLEGRLISPDHKRAVKRVEQTCDRCAVTGISAAELMVLYVVEKFGRAAIVDIFRKC